MRSNASANYMHRVSCAAAQKSVDCCRECNSNSSRSGNTRLTKLGPKVCDAGHSARVVCQSVAPQPRLFNKSQFIVSHCDACQCCNYNNNSSCNITCNSNKDRKTFAQCAVCNCWQLSTLLVLHKNSPKTDTPIIMACRPSATAALAAVIFLLAIALIVYAICVERPREPNNLMKFDQSWQLDSRSDSDESQPGAEFEPEAVLPVDGDVAGSVAGDLQDLLGKAMFLVGTTTTTTKTLAYSTDSEKSTSGSSLDVDMEHSASTTEVRCPQHNLPIH